MRTHRLAEGAGMRHKEYGRAEAEHPAEGAAEAGCGGLIEPVPRGCPEKMPDSRNGMIEQHPRPGIAHHGSDPLLKGRGITVRRAILAGAFPISVAAVFQPPAGIFPQTPAVVAQYPVALLVPTVEGDHAPQRLLLPFDACHSLISLLRRAVRANRSYSAG